MIVKETLKAILNLIEENKALRAERDALRCCGNCKDSKKICANNPFDICDGWEAREK